MYRRLAIATACLLLAAPGAPTADNPFGEEDCFPQEAYQTPDGQVDDAGVFSTDVTEFLDRLQELHDSPPADPDDTGMCVPGVGGPSLLSEMSQQEFLWPGDPLWGETDTESGEATIPESTPFQDLFSTQERMDTMREALSESQLLELLRGWPAPIPPYPANRTYDIKIVQVDTSEFPVINIQFKVFLYDTAPPSFAVYADEIVQDVQITEELLVAAESNSVSDFPANKFTFGARDGVDVCPGDVPVVMGIAMDASGSLAQRVKNELLPNAQAYVDWVMGTDSGTGLKINPDGNPLFDPPQQEFNQIAFFLFSTDVNERAPTQQDALPTGSFQGQTQGTQFQDRYNELKETTGSGASPIFQSMHAEMQRLAAHDAECGISKLLVSMTDFLDNQGGEDDLLEFANANDIFMANLLFGDPDLIDEYGGRETADRLAENDRGVVVQNANLDPRQAFYDLHMGAARTYCLRYVTPFPERWNDTVRVTMTLPPRENRWDESSARALYPLPIVVPEDTADVSVFFPISDLIYSRFATLGDKLEISGELELVDPYVGTTPPRPGNAGITPLVFETFTGTPSDPGPFFPPNPDVGAGLILGFANGDFKSFEAGTMDTWNEAFRVPTSPLADLASGALMPVSSGTHYAARVNLRHTDFTAGDCNITVGDAIVAVQDRTPPSVLVRLSPEQGQIPNELRIYERGTIADAETPAIDAHPWPLGPDEPTGPFDPSQAYDQHDTDPNTDYLSEKGAKSFGFGQKRARLRSTWMVASGDELVMVEDHDEDQMPWSEALFFDHEADPDLAPDYGEIPGTADEVADLPPFHGTTGGIRVPADVRVEIMVRARDNFAGLRNLGASYLASDEGANIWTNPLQGVSPGDPPPHARFDFDDPGIYMDDRTGEPYEYDYPGRNTAPPYLPVLTRTDMLGDPNRAGVCWWIESLLEHDRFAGGTSESERIDNIEFFQYPQSDTQEMDEDLDISQAMIPDSSGNSPAGIRRLQVWARDEHGNSTRFQIPIRIMGSDFKATAILTEGGRR